MGKTSLNGRAWSSNPSLGTLRIKKKKHMQPFVQSWLLCVTQLICEDYEVESIMPIHEGSAKKPYQIKNQNGRGDHLKKVFNVYYIS